MANINAKLLAQLAKDIAGKDGIVTQADIDQYLKDITLRANANSNPNLVTNGKVDLAFYKKTAGYDLEQKYVDALTYQGTQPVTAYNIKHSQAQDALYAQVAAEHKSDLVTYLQSAITVHGHAQQPVAQTKHAERVAEASVTDQILADMHKTPNDMISRQEIQSHLNEILTRNNATVKNGQITLPPGQHLNDRDFQFIHTVAMNGHPDINVDAMPAGGIKASDFIAKWTPTVRHTVGEDGTPVPAAAATESTALAAKTPEVKKHLEQQKTPKHIETLSTKEVASHAKAGAYEFNLGDHSGRLVVDLSGKKHPRDNDALKVEVMHGDPKKFELQVRGNQHYVYQIDDQKNTVNVYEQMPHKKGVAAIEQHLVVTAHFDAPITGDMAVATVGKKGKVAMARDTDGEVLVKAGYTQAGKIAVATEQNRVKGEERKVQEHFNHVADDVLQKIDRISINDKGEFVFAEKGNGVISDKEIHAYALYMQRQKNMQGTGNGITADEIDAIAKYKEKQGDIEGAQQYRKNMAYVTEDVKTKDANGKDITRQELTPEHLGQLKEEQVMFDALLKDGNYLAYNGGRKLDIKDMELHDAPSPGNSYAANKPAPGKGGPGV